MKTLCFSLSLILLFVATDLTAQNAVIISPRSTTITIGQSATFSISVTTGTQYDASIFLSSRCTSLEGMAALSVNPTIINYPYSKPSLLLVNTFAYTKRGVHTIYITAKIGSNEVKDSCTISVVNSSPWRVFSTISGTYPSYITVDKQGVIYYSQMTGANKLYQYGANKTYISDPTFGKKPDKVGPNLEVWQTLVDDDSETQYFLTSEGLQKYKDNEITIYSKTISALPNDTIKRGCIDLEGTVWLGTPSGLASLKNHTLTRYDRTNSELENENITALATGADGRLWIGTPNGLVVKDGNTWTRYTPQNSGLTAPYIFGLVVDKNGVVWMGAGKMVLLEGLIMKSYNDAPTSMVGLVRYDGTTWKQYDSTNSPLSSNYVNGLSVDMKGNLWIATASNYFDYDGYYYIEKPGCGLLKYDGTIWTTFTTSNSPLPDSNVQWVGADRYGSIWFVCRQQFGVYNEDGLPFLVNGVSEQPIVSDGITISPNPTSTSFTISGIEGVSSVRIMNSLGMEVKTVNISGTKVVIDASDLASGVYFVQFRSQTGVVSKPIVVSR